MDKQLQEYLHFAKSLAHEAGKIQLKYFRAEDINTVWKEDDTPLTIADTTINSMVIERVKEAYPEHGVRGEEESFGQDRTLLWVCDPVDGTMPYSIGAPLSTFSLALVEDGTPIVGVVYDAFQDRLWESATGMPTLMNGKEVQVNDKGMKNSYIGDDVWASGNTKELLFNLPGVRDDLLDRGALPITYSAAIITCGLIALGQFSGEIFAVRKPEDIAAIKLIVENAGGKVTDLDGNDQRYDGWINGAIVSNGVIHDELIDVVAQARLRVKS